VPRSRKYGSIHPLPHTPSWSSACLVKYRDTADNRMAIFEPRYLEKWKPRCLTALWASKACYRDSFTFLRILFRSFPFIIFLFHSHLLSLQLPLLLYLFFFTLSSISSSLSPSGIFTYPLSDVSFMKSFIFWDITPCNPLKVKKKILRNVG
jgi:hypothetical protein